MNAVSYTVSVYAPTAVPCVAWAGAGVAAHARWGLVSAVAAAVGLVPVLAVTVAFLDLMAERHALRRLVTGNVTVRCRVLAARSWSPSVVIAALAADTLPARAFDNAVRQSYRFRGRYDPDGLFGHDYAGHSTILSRVVRHPSCPPHVLERLAGDPAHQSRVAAHPSCPPDVLDRLATHDNPAVRSAVAGNPSATEAARAAAALLGT